MRRFNDLIKTKNRFDRLTAELRSLEKERKVRQAETVVEAFAKSGKTLDDVLIFFVTLKGRYARRVEKGWKFTYIYEIYANF